MPDKRNWKEKKPYFGRPHPGFNPNGTKCWLENWEQRMASRFTVVEVRCSTDPQPEDEPQRVFKIHASEHDAWHEAKGHMEWMRDMGALQPGVYTLTCNGRRHSFEVT